jgi:streptogramin lyase
METRALAVRLTAVALVAAGLFSAPSGIAADVIKGEVRGGGAPVANSTVTLWAAGSDAPRQLAQAQTGPDGRFVINANGNGAHLYLVATGGNPAANKTGGDNPALAMLTVVGSEPPPSVVINEMTTVASVWTHAQFLDGTAIKGTVLGLSIAAGNVPNFVDLQTGGYGVTIQDALNSTQTPTMANFATLASVLAGCVTQIKPDACSQFLAATTPRSGKQPADTLTALGGIARDSGYRPERLFALLDTFYPVPKGKNMRPTPFMPYLTWAPSAWTLPLKFTGGGLSAPGKLMLDSRGNVWAGNNFLVGAQNLDTLWDGNLSKFAPNGRPLSPMTSGFTGGGLQGIGFGMAIDAEDNVWATTYGSRAVVKFDNSGKPLSPAEGYNFNGQLGQMQGIIVTPSGDIWAVGITKNQLVFFPKGDPTQARIICEGRSVEPCKSFAAPFHLAIDQQDRIWVSNFISDWVTRFPASDPSKAQKFKTAISPGGMAVDGQGNVWVTSHFGTSAKAWLTLGRTALTAERGRDVHPYLIQSMVAVRPGPDGGVVVVLRPDGKPARPPIFGHGIVVPWAIAIDGNDHIWVSNFSNPPDPIAELCGYRTETCPPGMKMGDPISPPGGYVGGGMQMHVDIAIDPAGDVWVGNNWQMYQAALSHVDEALTTLGAGQGLVVFYGMAKPVKTPLIGPPRQP